MHWFLGCVFGEQERLRDLISSTLSFNNSKTFACPFRVFLFVPKRQRFRGVSFALWYSTTFPPLNMVSTGDLFSNFLIIFMLVLLFTKALPMPKSRARSLKDSPPHC